MDGYPADDLYARWHADLCHIYLTSSQPEPVWCNAGDGCKRLFQNLLYGSRQQDVFPETNHCRDIYYSHDDGHGPGNDAEKYFGKNTEGLAEEYGRTGIHHAGSYFSFLISRRTFTLIRISGKRSGYGRSPVS